MSVLGWKKRILRRVFVNFFQYETLHLFGEMK